MLPPLWGLGFLVAVALDIEISPFSGVLSPAFVTMATTYFHSGFPTGERGTLYYHGINNEGYLKYKLTRLITNTLY